MALRDEHADILGGPILQRPESGLFASVSQHHIVFKSFTLLGLSLLVWIACARGVEHLKKHRELRYRKAMRRKHGIPDSDCRPFAVAYAAAKRAHLEREAQDRKKTTNCVSDHNSPAVDQRTSVQKDARGLRRRVPETTVQLHDYQLPGKHASLYDNKRSVFRPLDFADRYNPNSRHRPAALETLPVKRFSVRRASRKDLVINLDHEKSRKRTFEDESDIEHETIKKSRIDGNELIDGDEQPDWYAQCSDMSHRRAPKESLDRQPEDNGVHVNGQERSKHVNDFPDEDHEPVDETMEVIDEDEVAELKAVARGKKRDRAEAGSTFGGDDDEDIRNGRASHYRKRRTILRRRSAILARGQKRDSGAELSENEDEGDGSKSSPRHAQRSSKMKRDGKATSDEVNEISVEDSRVSRDPLYGGHRVGDEWEADGVQYKVGNKGEQLRLALVKKAKNKYHMPQDSQHPDRSAALEIYVETWMTEEQYKQAEGKQELAWQETLKELSGSKTPEILDSPAKNGKNLLWDSVKGSPTRRPFRQFMPTNPSIRINPFEQWQLQPALGRRVASSSTTTSFILPGVTEGPTRPGFRGFSKWEKQDREAEAMARIRAKIEEQKKAQGPPRKSAEIPTSVTAPELGTKPLSVPTVTLTPVPAVAAEGKPDDSTAPSKSNTSSFSLATPPSTSDSIKGTAAAASALTLGFSLPSTFTPSTVPCTLFPSASIAPTTAPSTISLSPFLFAKPAQSPPSTSATTSSSAMLNFFGKDTGTGMLSTLGATTQPHSPLTEGVSKPSPFSFAKPETPSSTSSPAIIPGPSTKPLAPIFGAISGSSPSPATFGSTPTATKAETPVSHISSSTITSERSKPTAPLFSFSGAPSSSPSMPKFSFGESSTTSTSAPGSNLVSGTAPQSKPAFKFSQTPPGTADRISSSMHPAVDELRNLTAPVSVFGAATGSDGPAMPTPFGITPTFGSSTFSSLSASATTHSGKPVTVGSSASASTSPKPTLASTSTVSFDHTFSSTPAATRASGNAPVEAVGGPEPASMLGGNSVEGKPIFTFGASAEGTKPTSIFGGNQENSKPPSVFSGSAEGPRPTLAFGGSAQTSKPAVVFGGVVEGPKPTLAFSGAVGDKPTSNFTAESSLPSNTTNASKPVSITATTPFGSSPSASTFTFGKDDAAANASTFTGAQTRPTTPFAFGVPSGTIGSTFGGSSAFATSGDSSQSIFGKPVNATPSAFGFAGTGGSGSSSAFTFGKPATQNQKQEQ